MDNRERLASFPGIAAHCELGHVTTVHPESDPENSLLLKFSRVYRKENNKIMECFSPSWCDAMQRADAFYAMLASP